jgi:hypothetical protein
MEIGYTRKPLGLRMGSPVNTLRNKFSANEVRRANLYIVTKHHAHTAYSAFAISNAA